MPLHGIGQSPHDSFLVMYLSTTLPSSFMPCFESEKSREPTPVQFLIGASPFSIDSATAAVVPRCDHRRRIDAVGPAIFAPMRVISRYIQPSHPFGLAMYAMKRAYQLRSLLYSSVMRLQTALNSSGRAIGTSPVPATTIALRFFLP